MLVKLGVRSKMTLSLSYFLCPCWRDENWMNTVAHHEQHCSCLFSSCLGPLSPPPTWSTAGKSWTWHSWPTYSITIQPLMNPILKKCCQRSKKREKKKVKKKDFENAFIEVLQRMFSFPSVSQLDELTGSESLCELSLRRSLRRTHHVPDLWYHSTRHRQLEEGCQVRHTVWKRT